MSLVKQPCKKANSWLKEHPILAKSWLNVGGVCENINLSRSYNDFGMAIKLFQTNL